MRFFNGGTAWEILKFRIRQYFRRRSTKWSRETDADGDEMGRDMEKVFNNTIYNKAMIERGKARDGSAAYGG